MKTLGEWNPEYYKENSRLQENGAFRLINEIKFHGKENVLDLGCGDGRITAEISHRIPSGMVYGVDISIDMISWCKKQYKNIKNLSFYQGNLPELNFDIKFDFVVSFSALHWIKNKLEFFQKIFDILKSKGHLIALFCPFYPDPKFDEIYNSKKWKSKLPANAPFYPSTKIDTENLLTIAGFTEIKCEEYCSQIEFSSLEELMNWILAWAPAKTRLKDKDLLLLTEDLANNIIKHNKLENPSSNGLELKITDLVVKAAKS